ncbi:hypothetical protein CC80DRAFT_590240 [Byssothecium circinans]|uniref:Altered inheritance of mitochondria protein 9, mitochondrial n=1 Tax=Byssothecium circinans TaxID=147558 RepID=A0A6A5UDD8_9PLEO|nr:hypothetical protein CC80DRAFT_590240 [Byssothecium circinans]
MALDYSSIGPQTIFRHLKSYPHRQRSPRKRLIACFYARRMLVTTTRSWLPPLFAETARGEESIPEADLYRYTRQRWLTNERNELAKRHLDFSLPHLLEIAVKACEGASNCIKVLKLTEGLHNKAFLLSMDNGREVVAKLPNPCAGPAQYTTASEVATRKMLREDFGIPSPRVLSWSSDARKSPVQAEYILEEKAPGVRLGALWSTLPWKSKLRILDQVVEFDQSLTSVQFEKHGCIYFKDNLLQLTNKADAVQFTTDRQGLNLDHIIDWQSVTVAPLFYQSGVHRAFRHYKNVAQGWVLPEKPGNFDQLPPDEQAKIDRDMKSEKIHKYYELQTFKNAPLHWEYLSQPTVPVLRKPVWLVTGKEIFGEDSECPITFTKEELEAHDKEEEIYDGVGKILTMFRDLGILPADGMVIPEDYDTAVENSRQYKQIFLNSAETEEEKELYDKIWPYQDLSDEP